MMQYHENALTTGNYKKHSAQLIKR